MPLLAQPVITQTPTNQVLAAGAMLTLNVTANDPLAAFQWFKDSRRLLGATNSTLTVPNAGVTNSGTYTVVVTNVGGMVISLPALVAVGSPTLAAWGYNGCGELGDGMTDTAYLPITVASNVVAGAAGNLHSLFVTSDGTLWAMGDNGYGELGNGTYNATQNYEQQTPVSVASNVVAVAAGWYHSLFVTANGTLWAMGYNGYGQLGNGTTSSTNLPISVASNVVAVAAGDVDSLFVKTDGTLWSMGWNVYGQLGNGTNNANQNYEQTTPVCVASNVVAVAEGTYHSLFVKTDGTLWAMGYNGYGELGNGTTSNTERPISVASNVVAVAAGASHSLFVKTDGTLWVMGYNGYGQLGNGDSTGSKVLSPECVASNVVAVAAGTYHSLFVKIDGTLWAMGENNHGQLGNGTVINTNLPVNVPHLIAANVFPADQAGHSLAIGINYNAMVTLGNFNQTYTGNAISVTANITPPGLTVNLTYNGSPNAPTNAGSYTVIGTVSNPNYYGSATNTLLIMPVGPTNQVVAPGGTLTLVVAAGSAGQSYQWFKDSRLLFGATNSTLTMPNAGVINSGTYYVLVTNTGGMVISLSARVAVGNPTLMAWGYNNYGQLGNGTTSNTNRPITVANNAVAGAAGIGHSLFVTTDGTLWAMGYNGYGQLGIGTMSRTNQPAKVAGNVVAGAAGQEHSLFVTADGTLWAMGMNNFGQLGNGRTSSTNLPISVASNVVAAAAGGDHSLFLTTDGKLWAMGYNQFGQLATAQRTTPTYQSQ